MILFPILLYPIEASSAKVQQAGTTDAVRYQPMPLSGWRLAIR
jgi:hypothetical protein